ncbi:MAG: serpin family protein [Myxococcota bacterium]
MQTAANAVNDFSHDVFLETGEGNVAVSPISISAAMGMAYAGAAGETADEIASVFHYGDSAVPFLGALQTELGTRNAEFDKGLSLQLSIVNDLWLQQDFEVGDDYLSTVEEHFDAKPRAVDFKNSPESARKTINEHIADKTQQKIPELIAEGMIKPSIRTVLTNAIYLKAPWAYQFEESATKPGTFHAPDRDVEAQMMGQSEYLRRSSGQGFEALELPYKGNELAALIVLPEKGKMAQVADALDAEGFAQTVDGLEQRYTRVQMPRFEVRKKLTLGETLGKLGMSSAFADGANFDAIAPEMAISEVVHEAYMKVDEQGTEAAAAAAVMMGSTGMPPEPTSFVVDRPFLFYVFDRPTGTILFVARIVDPT